MRTLLLYIFCFFQLTLTGQDKRVIDEIIAVVGDEIVLQSELEDRVFQSKQNGVKVGPGERCKIVEEMLFTKLLLNKAQKDSITVSDQQVDYELERRMRYFIQQFGSQEKLEKFYGKSVVQIKSEFREAVHQQLLVQQMQQQLTSDVQVTPAEVKAFYNRIPKDSIPYIDSEVEVAQIVKMPPISDEERKRVKEKLKGFKERIENGEDFGTLAVLYSEDPGSARESGELGFMTRSMLVPEFARVLFSLEEGEVSGIVKTKFGYHIVQLIEKRGKEANARHILLKPKVKPEDMAESKAYLDSIYNLVHTYDTLSFEKAAALYSDDEDTRNNGGLMVNPMSGTSKFQMNKISEVDRDLFFVVNELKEGQVSEPEVFTTQDGNKAYRLIKLVSVTEPHKANLKQDYQRLQTMAAGEKQNRVMGDWINNNISNYYIRIDDKYKECNFQHQWLKKEY